MANFPLFGADVPGLQWRHVRYRPQGGGQPIKDYGNNATVARTGNTGEHTITWSDKPRDYCGFFALVGNSLAHDVRPVGAGYNAATGVLTVTTFADSTTGAVAADIAANANNTIDLWVAFANKQMKV